MLRIFLGWNDLEIVGALAHMVPTPNSQMSQFNGFAPDNQMNSSALRLDIML